MITDPRRRLVRFQQPDKTLPYLGPLDDTRIAALFGLDTPEYLGLLSEFENQVREVAEALVAEPRFTDAVLRLPFEPGQHVVAIGESTTADRLSWFEILRQLLAMARPDDRIRLTNLAVSGCTTTQALAQLPALSFHRPDWVLCMLGTNDAQRFTSGPTMVSLTETERNLVALRERAAPSGWVWLLPPTVDEARVGRYPHFQRAGIGWANKDLDAIADFLRFRRDLAVDAELDTSQADLWLDDGIHLSVTGQRNVAVALVETMAVTT
jgi:acyl-CoA thioesterase-1